MASSSAAVSAGRVGSTPSMLGENWVNQWAGRLEKVLVITIAPVVANSKGITLGWGAYIRLMPISRPRTKAV